MEDIRQPTDKEIGQSFAACAAMAAVTRQIRSPAMLNDDIAYGKRNGDPGHLVVCVSLKGDGTAGDQPAWWALLTTKEYLSDEVEVKTAHSDLRFHPWNTAAGALRAAYLQTLG